MCRLRLDFCLLVNLGAYSRASGMLQAADIFSLFPDFVSNQRKQCGLSTEKEPNAFLRQNDS